MASVTFMYAMIIIVTLAAIITGNKQPIFWGLLICLAAVAISFAGIFSAKKSTGPASDLPKAKF